MTADARAALEKAGLSRRGFLQAAGALVVGFRMASPQKAAAQATTPTKTVDNAQVDAWIAIGQDGTVTGFSGKCDFGQGFATVQYQLIAEELSVPLENVRLIACDTSLTPDQGVTSGSQSSPTQFGPGALRQALATARDALFQMAAAQFNVSTDALVAQNGSISMKSDATRSMTYAQLLAGNQFNLAVSNQAVPKKPANYAILGTPVPRVDIPAKVTGSYQYVQTVRLPGMLHGKVVRPPAVGAKVVSVNPNSLAGLPGNPQLVVVNDFVGVVADNDYAASQAAIALDITWSDTDPLPTFATLYDYMRQQPSRDSYTVNTGDVDATLKQATRMVNATYLHPYQMHGSLASSCAVADVRGGSGPDATATIWSATQGVYAQRDSAALLMGIPNQNVRVIFVEGSGCYGLNGNDSVSYDAALMSQAVSKPVRVQLSRRDEMLWGESYGPAAVIDMRAGLDAKNQIVAWDYEGWTLSKGNRPAAATPGNILTGALAGFPVPVQPPAAATPPVNYSNNGNTAGSYGAGVIGSKSNGTGTVRSERELTHTIQSPFFTGPLRSPNRLQNTFANECFMDEVAFAAKADPVQFRLQHLADPRLMGVLNAAAKQANWDTRPSPKPGNAKTGVVTGRGVSCVLYEGGNGYAAMVMEVQVDQSTGVVVVTRIVVSQDSGPVSNPDGLRNQMEGGAMQGMSRALFEEVKWNSSNVSTSNWVTYPVYHFGNVIPVVETVLINPLDKPQLGAGECAITLSGSALGNAIFDATGARVRQIPYTPARVLAALQARS
jgi:CO/xanthine dehydrogenase Mo-binding subunit